MMLVADTMWSTPTLLDFAAGLSRQSTGGFYSVEIKTQGFALDTDSVRAHCPYRHPVDTEEGALQLLDGINLACLHTLGHPMAHKFLKPAEWLLPAFPGC